MSEFPDRDSTADAREIPIHQLPKFVDRWAPCQNTGKLTFLYKHTSRSRTHFQIGPDIPHDSVGVLAWLVCPKMNWESRYLLLKMRKVGVYLPLDAVTYGAERGCVYQNTVICQNQNNSVDRRNRK